MPPAALPRRALLLAAAGLAFAPPSLGEGLFELVTEEEVAASAGARMPPLTRAITVGGPQIEVLSPQDAPGQRPPLAVRLRFRAPADAAIDPASFRAYYGALGLDITDRIRGHARIDRDGAVAENVGIPAGRHRVLVTVADTAGRTARREIRFTVD